MAAPVLAACTGEVPEPGLFRGDFRLLGVSSAVLGRSRGGNSGSGSGSFSSGGGAFFFGTEASSGQLAAPAPS